MQIVEPGARLLSITPDAERLIECAGRTCYKSEDRMTESSVRTFICNLLARGHLSVLEHAVATIKFVCDRGMTHELVRHRLASYSQESTRYCNYSHNKHGGSISVIEPPGLSDKARDLWRDSCRSAEETYFQLLEAGAPPQIARSVLPICLKTEIVVTANFREWRHILALRTSPKAHPQIRSLMIQAAAILSGNCPNVFVGAWGKEADS